MSAHSLNQFLVLYSWFPLAALLFFLLLIARFYERFSGERTYFRWLLLPLAGFSIAAMRAASIDTLNDTLIHLISALSGSVLLLLCLQIYRVMVVHRTKADDHE